MTTPTNPEATTEILDQIYLEWSQFTGARTARELALLEELRLAHNVYHCQGPCPGSCGRQTYGAVWCLSCERNRLAVDLAGVRKHLKELVAAVRAWRCTTGMFQAQEKYETMVRLTEDVAVNAQKNSTAHYCDRCDGCGWYEGGETLQTKCEVCNGAGVIPAGGDTES